MSSVAGPPTTMPGARGWREPARGHSTLGPACFVRRRLVLGGGLLAAGLAVAAALVLVFGASGETPPDTGTAALVPADALAYVNLSIDPARPRWRGHGRWQRASRVGRCWPRPR
jgi:hypothetical protein